MSEELTPKRGRGRPKGTGGNKRPDRTEAMSVHAEPGDNRRYIEHSMKMWDCLLYTSPSPRDRG